MVWHTLEQRLFLYATLVKYRSARKCRRKFQLKFRDETVLSRKTIHNFVNKLRTTGLLIDKKHKH
jgi:predicted ABC-type ATPase